VGLFACTGSGSGIGANLVSALRSSGHDAITTDLTEADILADLSHATGRERAIKQILKRSPQGLDGFIPAAGVGRGLATSTQITSVNYFGTVDLIDGLKPALQKKKGAVVLLGSNSAHMVKERLSYTEALLRGDESLALSLAAELSDAVCYMLGKRALIRWMRLNVMKFGREGIRINLVAPGPISTPMTEAILDQENYRVALDEMINATPLPRVGTTAEVKDAILFLLSSESSFVNGSVLHVDGGFHAHSERYDLRT
jgi:NAD(P)-dependent dehydrogenase (short-subunit alcohol dehydrogenase family)